MDKVLQGSIALGGNRGVLQAALPSVTCADDSDSGSDVEPVFITRGQGGVLKAGGEDTEIARQPIAMPAVSASSGAVGEQKMYRQDSPQEAGKSTLEEQIQASAPTVGTLEANAKLEDTIPLVDASSASPAIDTTCTRGIESNAPGSASPAFDATGATGTESDAPKAAQKMPPAEEAGQKAPAAEEVCENLIDQVANLRSAMSASDSPQLASADESHEVVDEAIMASRQEIPTESQPNLASQQEATENDPCAEKHKGEQAMDQVSEENDDQQHEGLRQSTANQTASDDAETEKDQGSASAFLASALSVLAIRSQAAVTGPLMSIGEYFAKLRPQAHLPSRAALYWQSSLGRSSASKAAAQLASALPVEMNHASTASLLSMSLGATQESHFAAPPSIAISSSGPPSPNNSFSSCSNGTTGTKASRTVPTLPNPLCLTTDVPRLVDEMLAANDGHTDVPRSNGPETVFGLPWLFWRSPEPADTAQTPSQVAHNAIAAQVLTQLSKNVVIAARSECKDGLLNANAEDLEAQKAAALASEELRSAKATEAEARRNLRALESENAPSKEVKAAKDAVRNLKKATAAKEAAEAEARARLADCVAKPKPVTQWHDRWSLDGMQDAIDSSVPFAVQLTPLSEPIFTIQGFIDALRDGTSVTGGVVSKIDPRCLIVPRHSLEVAFTVRAVDGVQLSVSGSSSSSTAARTHLPSAGTLGVGIADPGKASGELRTIHPTHAIMISMIGPTFPFRVSFGHLRSSDGDCFVGLGPEDPTSAPRWSPWNYLEMLPEEDGIPCLSIIGVVAALAPVVLGGKPLGPLSHARDFEECCSEASGNVMIGLVQAALFQEVKAWPILQPGAILLRWEFALRMLRFQLQRNCNDRRDSKALMAYADNLVEEFIPQILNSLKCVPHDNSQENGSLHSIKGNAQAPEPQCSIEESLVETVFTERLRRMEHSELLHTPFEAVSRFQAIVAQLGVRWPAFLKDTAAAPRKLHGREARSQDDDLAPRKGSIDA